MTQQTIENERAHPHTVTVTVNRKPVTFQDRQVTGLEIKQTAIDQGVAIELSFNLYEVKGHDRLDPIADDQRMTLNERDEFRAIAPDDNSGF